MNEDLKPSENCINLVKTSESCRLESYLCPAGKPTIGWGHTEGVELEQYSTPERCTLEQAELFLRGDLAIATVHIQRSVTVPLNQNQFDALVDFVFNVKLTEFLASWLLKKLNAGDYHGAANEFPRWVFAHVNGKAVVEPGLVTRRAKEKELFERPVA
jgi:lysozyme